MSVTSMALAAKARLPSIVRIHCLIKDCQWLSLFDTVCVSVTECSFGLLVSTVKWQKALNFGLHWALNTRSCGLGQGVVFQIHHTPTTLFEAHFFSAGNCEMWHANWSKYGLVSAWHVSRGTIPWPRWLHWPQRPWALERSTFHTAICLHESFRFD